MYRDASNYKRCNQVLLEGIFTSEQIEEMMRLRHDGEYFIPGDVGLPETRFQNPCEEDDHIWFEIDESGFTTYYSHESINTVCSANDVFLRWTMVDGLWNETEAIKRLDTYLYG